MLYSSTFAIIFVLAIFALVVLGVAAVAYCKTLLKEPSNGEELTEEEFKKEYKKEFRDTTKSFIKTVQKETGSSTVNAPYWAINDELADKLRNALSAYDGRPIDTVLCISETFSSFNIPCVKMDFCPNNVNVNNNFQVEKQVLQTTFQAHMVYNAIPLYGICVGIKQIRSGYYEIRILYALTQGDAKVIQNYLVYLRNNAILKAIAASAPIIDKALEQDLSKGIITQSNTGTTITIGFNLEHRTAIRADISQTGHICIVGGTGSGKSILTLYLLYNIFRLQMPVKLYIGDFKKSGDYKGITPHFAEFDEVVSLIDEFYSEFEQTEECNKIIKILLLDEYAGFITWLTQHDKKKAEEMKGKISNLLMLGRSRHCYVWCVQQRMTAQLFPTGIGAIDNFQICIGLGRLSVESRKSLFATEHMKNAAFEASFEPNTGEGLCLVDGQSVSHR